MSSALVNLRFLAFATKFEYQIRIFLINSLHFTLNVVSVTVLPAVAGHSSFRVELFEAFLVRSNSTGAPYSLALQR